MLPGKLLIDLDDFLDAWDAFAQDAFDAHFQGHAGVGAAGTGSQESDFDHAIGFDSDQFDISAVALNTRADRVDYGGYLLVHFRIWLGSISHDVLDFKISIGQPPARRFIGAGGIRTRTGGILNPLPLPLGYCPTQVARSIVRIFLRMSSFTASGGGAPAT